MKTSMSKSIVVAIAMIAIATSASAVAEIDGLVGQLSKANIEAHVNALAAEPRDDPASWATASTYIENQLISYGYTPTRQAVNSGEGPADNVSAILSGTVDPNQVFIVGAHYDSVDNAPGADDDASGVAVMLEIARVLAGDPRPWSVEFIAYAHEEKGLLGSTVHAIDAVTAGTDVVGMISLEMVGYTCPAPCQIGFPDIPNCLDVSAPLVTNGNFIAAIVNDASAVLARGFEVAASRYSPNLVVGTGQVALFGGCLSDTRRSDHAPYWDRNFPAMMLSDTANFRNPNYHDPTDTPATLNYDFAHAIARATLALAAARFAPTEAGIAAKKLLVIEKPGSGKIVFVAKDEAIDNGGAGDAALIDGALNVFYTNAPVDTLGVLTVPAPWAQHDDAVSKYKNSDAPTGGAVKVALVKEEKVAKVVAKGLGDGLELDIVSTAPGAGGLTTVLTTINSNDGTVHRFCTRFSEADGSTIQYKEIAGGDGRKLLAKDGVAVACP